MKALLCINNPEDMATLTQVLRLAHVQVLPTDDLLEGLESWTKRPADLIVLALTSPEIETAVKQIRLTTDVPLIVVVDGISEDKCLDLYKAGSDLVVMRPYSPRLLRAQAEILLKRGLSIPLSQIPPLYADNFEIDPSTRSLQIVDGPEAVLTQREFQLLYLLWLNRGQILTTAQIIEAIWGYTGRGDRNMLRSLVNRVRKKIEPDVDHPRYLVTISGVGYKFIV